MPTCSSRRSRARRKPETRSTRWGDAPGTGTRTERYGPACVPLSGPQVLGCGPLIVSNRREIDVVQIAAGRLEIHARPLVTEHEGDCSAVEVARRDHVDPP